jgi:hippurate hydrolase
MTMLLGAAKYLAETRDFAGTVHLICQPAEEGAGGGRRMVEEGLFEKFPVEAVYGMHNMPGISVGSFGTRTGSILSAMDLFEIRINGVGTHAATPELGVDPILATAHVVVALQGIVSREIDPVEGAVVTITEIKAALARSIPFLPGVARAAPARQPCVIREARLRRVVGRCRAIVPM